MSKFLSAHFILAEFTYSSTAKACNISNVPTPQHERVLAHTCQYLLEPLRTLLNAKYQTYCGKVVDHVSIRITSGYRSAALNTKISDLHREIDEKDRNLRNLLGNSSVQ